MTGKSTAFILGAIVGTYFIVYPVFYFAWNWFIVEIDFPQYQIPGFWVGMVGYLIFNFALSIIRGIFK
jgi:hypothetical protein